jgi:multiple sugar transport system permease protein
MGQTATTASLAPPIRRGRASAWADRHFKWLMVAPAVLIILAFSIYPLLFSLWVAFVNYDFQVPGHAFVGLQSLWNGPPLLPAS